MANPERTYLGFDFGMRRIGVAVGQSITLTAQALNTLKAVDGIPNWELIAKLIKTWNPVALIVGIPLNMDGTEQSITNNARRFANRLNAKFKLPVHPVDERLTTVEAKALFLDKITSEIQIDSYAAKLILESWLRNEGATK